MSPEPSYLERAERFEAERKAQRRSEMWLFVRFLAILIFVIAVVFVRSLLL